MFCSFVTIFAVAAVSPAWGTGLIRAEFEEFLEPQCFRTDEQHMIINGQVNPLSQTLENFIALAEKFELANHDQALRDELFYFIRNYTYDNIEYSPQIGDVIRWTPKDSNFDILDTFWGEPDDNQRKKLPQVEDPFTDDEKCSLYHMLSHSIIREPRTITEARSAGNFNRSRSVTRPFDLDRQYPIEIGVVSIHGTTSAVSLGRVLTGMYVGLDESRKRNIDSFPRIPKQELPSTASVIDPLYSLTMAEVIALSTWRAEVGNRDKLAMDGSWVSPPIGTDLETSDICPMLYTLKAGTTSAYSYSSMRGAADGLILGSIMPEVESKSRTVKLSQILRMYYSRGGLLTRDDQLGSIRASVCNRQGIVDSLETTIKEQVLLYQLLASTGYKNIETNLDHSWDYYQGEKMKIYQSKEIDEYCRKELTEADTDSWPIETPLDITVILDTGYGKQFLEKQQLIIGFLAKQIELRYSGSRMTVLTNQKAQSSDVRNRTILELRPAVPESFSTGCVACHVTQFASEDTTTATEDYVIVAINQLLHAKKDNETRYNGATGKVVLYFNFNEDAVSARSASPMPAGLDKALKDLHSQHQDVTIYALGRETQFVKRYVRNEMAYVLSAVEETEIKTADKLLMLIDRTPARLQFANCENGDGEKTAIYENFVSPNTIQHWAMPAKFFYKSRGLKFFFDSQYGPIKVCHSRATYAPDRVKESCKDVTPGKRAEFQLSNPCNRLNDRTCSPFFFSILGINVTDSATTNQEICVDTKTEALCRTMDQIKFKVYHEGVRCSGATGLFAMPILVLLCVFLLQKVFKQ